MTTRRRRHSIQTYWRIAGGVAISVCAAMTVFGWLIMAPGTGPTWLLVYWSIWLVLLLFSLYVVMVDLRFLRARFLAEERNLFKETMGEAAIRDAIIQAQRDLQSPNEQPPQSLN